MAFAKLSGSLLACRETMPTAPPWAARDARSGVPLAAPAAVIPPGKPDLFRARYDFGHTAPVPPVPEVPVLSASALRAFAGDNVTPFDPALRQHLKALKLSAFLHEYDELA